MITLEEARKLIDEAMLTMKQEKLDAAVVGLVFAFNGDRDNHIEAIMREEIVKMPHDVQHFWLSERCDCELRQ